MLQIFCSNFFVQNQIYLYNILQKFLKKELNKIHNNERMHEDICESKFEKKQTST